MKEKIPLNSFTYGSETEVPIRGNVLLAMLNFVNEVVQKESHESLLFSLPEIKGKEIQWKGTKIKDFFEQEPQNTITLLGVKGLDLQYILEDTHAKAIDKGLAIKSEEVGGFQLPKTEGNA